MIGPAGVAARAVQVAGTRVSRAAIRDVRVRAVVAIGAHADAVKMRMLTRVDGAAAERRRAETKKNEGKDVLHHHGSWILVRRSVGRKGSNGHAPHKSNDPVLENARERALTLRRKGGVWTPVHGDRGRDVAGPRRRPAAKDGVRSGAGPVAVRSERDKRGIFDSRAGLTKWTSDVSAAAPSTSSTTRS